MHSELAVVIMAYNEPEVLARAIESVREWAPVHVSVDAADTAGCVQVALDAGCAVYSHEGLPHPAVPEPGSKAATARNSYARMRNDVLADVREREQASWFLWLDADELVSEGAEELLAYLPTLPKTTEAVAVRMDLYSREGVLESVMRNSKVIRRGVTFTRRRHEHIVPAAGGDQALCEQLVIDHRPTQSLETRKQHDDRKTQLEPFLEDWREFRDGRAAFYLADKYTLAGDTETALRWYDKALALPDALCPGYQRAQAAIYAAKLYIQNQQPTEARECLQVALRNEWRYAEACYYMGFIAANTGDFDQAEHWFQVSLLHPPAPQTIMQQEQGCSTYMPALGLAAIEAHRGNRARAYELIDRAERMAGVVYRGTQQVAALRETLDRM